MTPDEFREAVTYPFDCARPTHQPVVDFAGDVAFELDDVDFVLAYDCEDGDGDGDTVRAVFRLAGGRWVYLNIGCDSTGWDCQSGGNAWAAADLESLVQYGLDSDAMGHLDPAVWDCLDVEVAATRALHLLLCETGGTSRRPAIVRTAGGLVVRELAGGGVLHRLADASPAELHEAAAVLAGAR